MGAFLSWGDPGDPASGTLRFDVVRTEEHEISATITEHSVEQGVNISDHVRPEPDRINLEAYVSNAPVRSKDGFFAPTTLSVPDPPIFANINGAFNALSNALRGPNQFTANLFQFPSAADYVAGTLATLRALRDTATLLRVVCPNALYTDMVIETIGLRRSAEDGTGGSFSVGLKQIRVVKSSVTQAPVPTILRASPATHKGGKAAEETPEPRKSLLNTLLSGAGIKLPPAAQ